MFLERKNKIIFLLLFLILLLGANFVSAMEIQYPNIPGIPGISSPQKCIDSSSAEEIPSCYARYIISLLFFISLAIFWAVLVIGGARYIFFASSAQQRNSARNQISSAFFGLMILFCSVLILNTINPQITVFRLPRLSTIIVSKAPNLKPPPSEKPRTLINIEIPFGNIIEKRIFETKLPSGASGEPRMERIKSLALNTYSTTQKIKEESIYLRTLVLENCFCSNNDVNGDYCTCDPCSQKTIDPKTGKSANSRTLIQKAEKENLKLIGIEKKESSDGKLIPLEISFPNLISEQEKTIKEIRLLKQELTRLRRAELFMSDCRPESLTSLSNYEHNKDWYDFNEWYLIKIRFWDEIIIDISDDYATFYCPISGTIIGEIEDLPDADIKPPGDYIEPPNALEKLVCEEVPIGKIIDRSKKIGDKLIENMEALIILDRRLIDAVDHLHFLISKCTSQNCTVQENEDGSKYCKDDPCPDKEINQQMSKISYISERIGTIVNESDSGKIGIISLIKIIKEGLLVDFKKKIKKPMQE